MKQWQTSSSRCDEFDNEILTKIKIIESKLPLWRKAAVNNPPSGPKYVDFDWRIHTESGERSAFMQVQVQDEPQNVLEVPGTSKIEFELYRYSMKAFVDQLAIIKEQINGLTS